MTVVTNNTISTNSITEATSANGVSIDGLKIKDYSLMYGSNIGLTIDSSGYVLTPKAVWFRAYNGAIHNPTSASATVEFSSCDQDSSNSYSTTNDYFTAPVGGAYYFSYYFMNNDNEYCRHSFYINDAVITNGQMFAADRIYAGSVNYLSASLSAGDNVRIKVNINSANEGHVHSDFRVFTGFLIG